VIGIFGTTLTVPKYLVISVMIYSALLTFAIAVIGRRLIKVIAGKNAAEAQLRSIGSHLLERGAITSTSQDEAAQHRSLSGAVDDLIARWRDLCHQLVRITVVSHGNILLAPVIGWVLCAPKYLFGAMSLGEVARATAAFVVVLAALNWMVDNYSGLVDCLSSINRVASLLLALDELERGAIAATGRSSIGSSLSSVGS
jgi:putative ATP-binding cassette transporter